MSWGFICKRTESFFLFLQDFRLDGCSVNCYPNYTVGTGKEGGDPEHGFFLLFKNTSPGSGATIPKVGVNLDLISCAEQLLGYLGFHLSWTELFSATLSCIQKVNLMHIGKFLKHQETSHHFFHQALGVFADI